MGAKLEKIRAAQISSKALKTRKLYLATDAHLPICPYNLCEAMGFDLRFVNIPSFEGMYVASKNLILISSVRPEGRKRFTCAHEIGHHVLGHGTIIDEILINGSNKKEEQEADFFASMLLMPSSAVNRTLNNFGVSSESLTEQDAYILSKYFGVSFEAFITHIYNNLRLISYKHYQTLKKSNLADIRFSISGLKTKNQIFKIGPWWDEKAIELEVGDYIVSNNELNIDGPKILECIQQNDFYTYKAMSPGITRLFSNSWSSFSKVSSSKFHGFFQYKYDEEVI